MSRAFTDANVLFSAAISPRSVSRAIFELAHQSGEVELVMSGYAISEALSNLQNKRPEAVVTALDLLDGIGFVEEPPQALADRVRHLVPDPKDVPILAGAVWAEADLLVTGDSRDFGKLYGKNVGGCLVARPREALDLLLSEAES